MLAGFQDADVKQITETKGFFGTRGSVCHILTTDVAEALQVLLWDTIYDAEFNEKQCTQC